MARAYLLLGSNIGERKQYLSKAESAIENSAGYIIVRSGIYETAAWGYNSKNDFLNMAMVVETSLGPGDLLSTVKKIEKSMGRKASAGYSDREIDIDIIFYDDLVLETDDLTIPHSLMHKRKFVLEPLAEIAGDKVHPVLGKTVSELLKGKSKK